MSRADTTIALITPRRSQRETAVSDNNVESYQPPSHQLELPIVLAQDSITRSPHQDDPRSENGAIENPRLNLLFLLAVRSVEPLYFSFLRGDQRIYCRLAFRSEQVTVFALAHY